MMTRKRLVGIHVNDGWGRIKCGRTWDEREPTKSSWSMVKPYGSEGRHDPRLLSAPKGKKQQILVSAIIECAPAEVRSIQRGWPGSLLEGKFASCR